MSGDVPLFDVAEAGIVPVPAAAAAPRSLKDRQAAKISVGEHPLSGVGQVPARIPLAPAGTGTCGTCVHKMRPHHHQRRYPKCGAGSFRVPDGDGYREVWPRAAHSEATDLRSWWPACTAYEPREDTR